MSKGCGKKGNSHLSCVITPPRKYNDNNNVYIYMIRQFVIIIYFTPVASTNGLVLELVETSIRV